MCTHLIKKIKLETVYLLLFCVAMKMQPRPILVMLPLIFIGNYVKFPVRTKSE